MVLVAVVVFGCLGVGDWLSAFVIAGFVYFVYLSLVCLVFNLLLFTLL